MRNQVTVTNPKTGKVSKFTGDEWPTLGELKTLVAHVKKETPTGDRPSSVNDFVVTVERVGK